MRPLGDEEVVVRAPDEELAPRLRAVDAAQAHAVEGRVEVDVLRPRRRAAEPLVAGHGQGGRGEGVGRGQEGEAVVVPGLVVAAVVGHG